MSKPTVAAQAIERRRQSLITGAAGYVLAQWEAGRKITVATAAIEYMRGQGLRRATLATWDIAQRRHFIAQVRARVEQFNTPPS